MMNGKVEYAIMHGEEGKFVINATSGIITTAGALDRETKDSYTVNAAILLVRVMVWAHFVFA